MEQYRTIVVDAQEAVARVTLNRPERRNALNDIMAADLERVFDRFKQDASLRLVVLTGNGPAFCAGADLHWLQAQGLATEEQATADALQLAAMFRAVEDCPCPVIGLVQGPAFGGGVGLMAACDIVVAAEGATFTLSETALGLVPAIIAPLLLRKAGESFFRRYVLTGEPFDARAAQRFGLVHEVLPREALDQRERDLTERILRLAPGATRASKSLLRRLLPLREEDRLVPSIQANVAARGTREAEEGLRAFLAKRAPRWIEREGRQAAQGAQEMHDAAAQQP